MPHLTPTQARLRDDIRGLIRGDVACDEVTRQLYSTDAGILQCRPMGVVWPRDSEDVIACVRYASEKRLSIHARGLGTGLAGESLGSGIVLDFTRSMRRLLSLGHESVVVQPGITRHRLNTVLKKTQRRCFGPLTGFGPTTTIGSMLARNGAGPHWLRYGFPSEHLLRLKVVLANGETAVFRRDRLPQAVETERTDDVSVHSDDPYFKEKENVARGLSLARGIVLGKEHGLADEVYRVLSAVVPDDLPDVPPVDRAGYRVRNVLTGPGGRDIDLARLFCGSEGTLGLIVEAELATASLPRRGAAAVLFFNGLERAVRAVESILPFAPILCELVDRRRLTMLREGMPRFHELLPVEAEAILLIELDAGTAADPTDPDLIRDRLSRLLREIQEKEELCFRSIRIETEPSFDLFDELIHYAELVLFRMRQSFQALPLFDDLAVPVPLLRTFLFDLLDLLRRHEITASISGHVGQGHVRLHPILDLSQAGLTRTLRHLAEEVYDLVLSHSGSISSEGGTGLLKSLFVPRQFPHLAPVFRELKRVFDPVGILNPGKVVPETSIWTEPLRRGLSYRGGDHPFKSFAIETPGDLSTIFLPPPETESDAEAGETAEDETMPSQLEVQLKWEPQRIFEATHLCNGCGDCLRSDRAQRTCPLFRRETKEEAAPRAKANLLRGVLEGELELATLTRQRTKEVADHCFHCQMCGFECPAEVDVSQLAYRCKSAYVAAHGMSLEDLFFSRIDVFLKGLALISCPVNWSLTNRTARWIMEKILQIPQGRELPKLSKSTFLGRTKWAARLTKSQSVPGTKVALFVDTFSNHFDARLAEWAVRILEHNDIAVHVPSRQRASGLMAFAAGSMERFERLARHNSLLLADLIRQGYQVVTLEPASASCITRDYRAVVDDIDAALVMSNVVDFCTFLFQRHGEGKLKRDFIPLNRTTAYHAPCRAISITTQCVAAPTPAEELLRLIPELTVHRIEQGCCGLAGVYGLKLKNHRHSVQIGLPLFRELRKPEFDFGATDCNACRMQMQHGTRKQVHHPIRLLAAAYGFAPLENESGD